MQGCHGLAVQTSQRSGGRLARAVFTGVGHPGHVRGRRARCLEVELTELAPGRFPGLALTPPETLRPNCYIAKCAEVGSYLQLIPAAKASSHDSFAANRNPRHDEVLAGGNGSGGGRGTDRTGSCQGGTMGLPGQGKRRGDGQDRAGGAGSGVGVSGETPSGYTASVDNQKFASSGKREANVVPGPKWGV